jgi:hypothetical protein
MEERISKIIIIIIGLAIILGIFAIKAEDVKNLIKGTSCSADVIQKAKFKILGKSGVELRHCEMNTLKFESKKDLEKAKEKIANKMYDCWKQFGRGEIDFLDDLDFGTSETYCFICTQITFSKDLRNKKITGFAKYLDETLIPLGNITYTEYFTKSKNTKFNIPELSELKEISANEDIYILFVAKKGDIFEELKDLDKLEIGAVIVSSAAGFLIGGPLGGIATGIISATATGTITATIMGIAYKTKYYSALVLLQTDKLVEACKK